MYQEHNARWIVGLALLATSPILPVCAEEKKEDTVPSKKVKEILGDKTIAILQGATRIEIFRIDPDSSRPGKDRIGGYVITATGKEKHKEFTAKLVEVLLADGTYFGRQAKCFDPGLAFRLWKDNESVEVVVCFHCTTLEVSAKDAKGRALDDVDEKKSGGFGGETGSYAMLVKLAKDAFPDDKDIQALKDKGK
jgi:hypothetical protein